MDRISTAQTYQSSLVNILSAGARSARPEVPCCLI